MPSWNWRITPSIFAGTPKRENFPQQLPVDRVIRFLQVDEAHVEGNFPLARVLAIVARRTACRLLIVLDKSQTVPQGVFPAPHGNSC